MASLEYRPSLLLLLLSSLQVFSSIFKYFQICCMSPASKCSLNVPASQPTMWTGNCSLRDAIPKLGATL